MVDQSERDDSVKTEPSDCVNSSAGTGVPVAGKPLPRAVLPALLGPGVGGRWEAAGPPGNPAAEP